MGLFGFFKRKSKKDELNHSNENIEPQIEDTNETLIEDNKSDLDTTTPEIMEYTEDEDIEDVNDSNEENSNEDLLGLDTTNIKEEELLESQEISELIDDSNKEDNTEKETTEEKPQKGFFKRIFSGLDKTRKNIIDGVENVLKSFTKIDDELFEELEETLIMADIGVETSTLIINLVKDRVKKEKITESSFIKDIIKEEITKILVEDETELTLESPSVILVIGVNGVGKTTTIGKISNSLKKEGKKVVLAAADTFRAAAIDQLEVWGNRSGVDVIKHQENSDPGAVVYDAIQASKARKADVLICDTAGRLHNKKNLMEELRKIFKIVNKEYNNAQLEVFLVLDATTGQNALQQAKLFKEVANITGLVLTKLDGTAKGGIIIAIKNELKIPVRYIGVGEGVNDLQPFNAKDFAAALFGDEQIINE